MIDKLKDTIDELKVLKKNQKCIMSIKCESEHEVCGSHTKYSSAEFEEESN